MTNRTQPSAAHVAGTEDAGTTTSVEQTTQLLREAIVQGHFGPGQRIKITEAAQFLNVGAMPVREALRKLEGEGLVSIAPNRGATVREVNRQFIEDIFEVRTTLEVMIIRRCIERLTFDRLQIIEELVRHLHQAIDAEDSVAMTQLIRTLHTQLFEIAGNAEATRIFQREWEIVVVLRGRFGYGKQRLTSLKQEFDLLLTHLRHGDAAGAERVIRLHNRAGMEDLLGRIAQIAPGGH